MQFKDVWLLQPFCRTTEAHSYLSCMFFEANRSLTLIQYEWKTTYYDKDDNFQDY